MLDGDGPKRRVDEPPSLDENANHYDCVSLVESLFSGRESSEAQRQDLFCKYFCTGTPAARTRRTFTQLVLLLVRGALKQLVTL